MFLSRGLLLGLFGFLPCLRQSITQLFDLDDVLTNLSILSLELPVPICHHTFKFALQFLMRPVLLLQLLEELVNHRLHIGQPVFQLVLHVVEPSCSGFHFRRLLWWEVGGFM